MCSSNSPRGSLLWATLYLAIFAIILMAAGFLTPGWTYIKQVSFQGTVVEQSAHIGLWYIVVCQESSGSSNCISETSTQFEPLDEYRIEASVAMACAVLALILVTQLKLASDILLKGAAVLFTIVAGVLGLVASAKRGAEIADKEDETTRFPYSLLIFGVGAVLFIICCLLIIIEIWRSHALKQSPSYRMRQQQNYPKRYISDPYPSGMPTPYDDFSEDSYPYRNNRDDRPYGNNYNDEYHRKPSYRRPNDEEIYPPSPRDRTDSAYDYRSRRLQYPEEKRLEQYSRKPYPERDEGLYRQNPYPTYKPDVIVRDYVDIPRRPYSTTYDHLPRVHSRSYTAYPSNSYSVRPYVEESPCIVRVEY